VPNRIILIAENYVFYQYIVTSLIIVVEMVIGDVFSPKISNFLDVQSDSVTQMLIT